MTWYRLGTVAVTLNSKAVVGTSTGWSSISGSAIVGSGFRGPDGRVYEVASLNSDTSLTLVENYLGATASGQAYALMPTLGLASDLAVAVAQLITTTNATVGSATTIGKSILSAADAAAVRTVAGVDTELSKKADLTGANFTGNVGSTGSFKGIYLWSTAGGQVDASFTVGQVLKANGILKPAGGIRCYAGAGLGEGGNTFSLFWNGSAMNLYADSTYLGYINYTSDERIKRDIVLASPQRDKFMGIHPIVFDYAAVGIFRPSGRRILGFSAQNLTEVLPQAVDGSVNAVDANGKPVPANVQDRPILALTVLEVQQLVKDCAALAKRVADLEDSARG